MDTDDYIGQCISHLSDTSTYRLQPITQGVTSMYTVVRFKPQIHEYDWKLYKFLLSEPDHSRIPQFCGIPKIHKKFTRVAPVRPIVSQCNSVLTPTAKFIDHILQPLGSMVSRLSSQLQFYPYICKTSQYLMTPFLLY